jgi:outer membrane protein TolC
MVASGRELIRSADPVQGSSTPLPLPLPDPLRDASSATMPAAAPSTASAPPPPALRLDTTLIPGRTIEPIDLVSALRLAGERDLDIAIARQRVLQSLADLEKARSLWLPSLFLGPTYYRADGQVQTINGPVVNVNRGSLFLGGTAATVNGFPGPSPGTGYPQLNSLSSVIRISDIIFEPLAARRVVAAGRAAVHATTNDALLAVAEAYLDLQVASGQLAIAGEAASNAGLLAQITESYARVGEGLEADRRRALAELKHQRKNIQAASGQLLVASDNLMRQLTLSPRVVVAPVEPAESILHLVPEDAPLDDLIVEGLRYRPELAQSQELVQAALVRLKQARLRPFIPSVAVTYAGGGFGGGQGGFFGNFGARGDAMASLFWEVQHLGFGDRAVARRNAAEQGAAMLELNKVANRVAAEVAAARDGRTAAARQIAESSEAVSEALESLKLNLINMQQGAGLPRATRPIEVLQPIQALAQARLDYLDSVIAYNRAQFRLKRAIGQQP